MILTIASVLASVIWIGDRMRCPKCNGSLAAIARDPLRPFIVVSCRIRYCPYCGLDLQQRMADNRPVGDGAEARNRPP